MFSLHHAPALGQRHPAAPRLLALLLAPFGTQASVAGQIDNREKPRWEATAGPRHFVFACPDGYPATGVSLADLSQDCELLDVFFCFEQASWHPTPGHPGCDAPRRL